MFTDRRLRTPCPPNRHTDAVRCHAQPQRAQDGLTPKPALLFLFLGLRCHVSESPVGSRGPFCPRPSSLSTSLVLISIRVPQSRQVFPSEVSNLPWIAPRALSVLDARCPSLASRWESSCLPFPSARPRFPLYPRACLQDSRRPRSLPVPSSPPVISGCFYSSAD